MYEFFSPATVYHLPSLRSEVEISEAEKSTPPPPSWLTNRVRRAAGKVYGKTIALLSLEGRQKGIETLIFFDGRLTPLSLRGIFRSGPRITLPSPRFASNFNNSENAQNPIMSRVVFLRASTRFFPRTRPPDSPARGCVTYEKGPRPRRLLRAPPELPSSADTGSRIPAWAFALLLHLLPKTTPRRPGAPENLIFRNDDVTSTPRPHPCRSYEGYSFSGVELFGIQAVLAARL